jgi:hypothetical protein
MRRLLSVVAALVAVVAPSASTAASTALRATASPSSVAFGDVFVYTVAVPLPPGTDADTVEIIAPTRPFTTMKPAEQRTSTVNGTTVVELRQSLACLEEDCLPFSGPRRASLSPATAVVGRARIGSRPVFVEITPRVSAAAVRRDQPVFRRGPLLSEDRERGLSAATFLVAGVATLLVGLLALVTRPRRPKAMRRGTPDSVERARRLLLASVARSPTARRRAASLAGRVAPDELLSHDAQRIAWSPEDPTGDDAVALADRLPARVGRR